MFLAKGITRSCEKEVYNEGCIPDSGYTISWDVDFEAHSKEELLEKIKEFHSEIDDAILDEGNRVYIQTTEIPLYDRWISPTEKDKELWKKGEKEIFVVDYSYKILREV